MGAEDGYNISALCTHCMPIILNKFFLFDPVVQVADQTTGQSYYLNASTLLNLLQTSCRQKFLFRPIFSRLHWTQKCLILHLPMDMLMGMQVCNSLCC